MFWYHFFVAVFAKLRGNVPVVDDVLSSHEQEIYISTSLDENFLDLDFQTDRNYYVYLRQTHLALKVKFVKGRGYETYNIKEIKKKLKEEKNGCGDGGG